MPLCVKLLHFRVSLAVSKLCFHGLSSDLYITYKHGIDINLVLLILAKKGNLKLLPKLYSYKVKSSF